MVRSYGRRSSGPTTPEPASGTRVLSSTRLSRRVRPMSRRRRRAAPGTEQCHKCIEFRRPAHQFRGVDLRAAQRLTRTMVSERTLYPKSGEIRHDFQLALTTEDREAE